MLPLCVNSLMSATSTCGASGLALQVLGSGGGFASTGRASPSYLVWKDGRAALLVDAGGGASLRFAESKAKLSDLHAILLTHFHPDHTSELPALLWHSERARLNPLPVLGPAGNDAFPGLRAFAARLFGTEGAFPVMGEALGGSGGSVRLQLTEIDPAVGHAAPFGSEIEILAQGVHHANVPALAYRVEVDGRSIVFGGDQSGTDGSFVKFAREADLLVMPLGFSTRSPLSEFLASPKRVGELAREAKVKHLILAHFMRAFDNDPHPEYYSLAALDESVASVREAFPGTITVSTDLQCVPIR